MLIGKWTLKFQHFTFLSHYTTVTQRRRVMGTATASTYVRVTKTQNLDCRSLSVTLRTSCILTTTGSHRMKQTVTSIYKPSFWNTFGPTEVHKTVIRWLILGEKQYANVNWNLTHYAVTASHIIACDPPPTQPPPGSVPRAYIQHLTSSLYHLCTYVGQSYIA